MKLSLRTKVSLFITILIVLISAVSTYLSASAFSSSKERGRLIRGSALSYALSKAAEEGLLTEDLNLIQKASSVIMAPDVVFAQVYSNIWEAVDAFPFDQLKNPPHPQAVAHFKNESTPVHIAVAGGYDFYAPILFKAFEDSPAVIIGYVRLMLSSAAIGQELKKIIVANILVAAIITLVAIISLNILIGRLIVNPVMALYRSMSMLKNGLPSDDAVVPGHAADEIRELSVEFTHMRKMIQEKESRLVESERRIRSLFDRVEHGIFRINENGSIVETNSRFQSMFGDVTGLCDILIGDRSASDCLRKAVMEKALHIEDRAVGRNGEELTVSLSLYPDTDEHGNVTGFDGYIIDITEKKRMEDRLIRAQKMEAVGTLAGGMAHDFNNLLTAILGYSGILLKMVKEGEPFHKPVSIIHDAAKRGAEFGKKILTISRKERIEAKPVNINDIVKNSLELLQRSFPKDIEIVTNLREDIPLIKADPSQIQQVIINLAVNARDAMPDGGKLIVETSSVGAENGAVWDGSAESGDLAKLSVADTGMGIDAETQTKIFDPFFTTKDVGKGTGLGLYIVHSIIHKHGGYINLYSEPFKGTRFNIYLPALAKGVDAEAPHETTDVRGAGTILVIDDEPHVRELCKDTLSSLGYLALSAENGSAGIQIYRERKDSISLVILDMVMPKMGGTEVFNALKTINPDVKVLLYSGYSHNNFAGINELLKRGAAGFIQKPFSTQDIGIAIKKALSQGPFPLQNPA